VAAMLTYRREEKARERKPLIPDVIPPAAPAAEPAATVFEMPTGESKPAAEQEQTVQQATPTDIPPPPPPATDAAPETPKPENASDQSAS